MRLAGRLDPCFLLAFQVPADRVAPFIPRGLELLARGPWAYWNVVVSRIHAMRPEGLPTWAGITYHHIAYRLYVRARLRNGGEIEGLHFTRSDSDDALVNVLGDRLTDFKFHHARVAMEGGKETGWAIHAVTSGGQGDLDLRLGPGEGEPVPAFLKYRPLGLCPDPGARRLRVVQVVRDEAAWMERGVQVAAARFAYFEAMGLGTLPLVGASRVEPMDYGWAFQPDLLLP